MISLKEARSLLSRHGITRPQSISDWSGPFRLPGPVQAFYDEVGPIDVTIPALGNDYFFPSLKRLWELQAGYRYNSLSGDPIKLWEDNWIVVVNEAGDPFIFDSTNGDVLHAIHGLSTWSPRVLFPSLASMAGSLAVVGAIILDAGPDLTDHKAEIRKRYLRDLKGQLKAILDEDAAVNLTLDCLGWNRD
jgi:hypothetical protein